MKKLCVPSKVFCRRLEPACEPWSAQRCFALPFRGRAGAHIPISDAHSGWTILETLLEGNADAPRSHAGWQPGLEGAHGRQRAERCETSEHELCPTFDPWVASNRPNRKMVKMLSPALSRSLRHMQSRRTWTKARLDVIPGKRFKQ